jgi:hypothetical protein
MTSPYLIRDEKLRAMTKALRNVDLACEIKRVTAYQQAGIEGFTRLDDAEAILRAEQHRVILSYGQMIGEAVALIALVAGFLAVWAATPSWADSGGSHVIAPANWLCQLGMFAAIGFFAFLKLFCTAGRDDAP